MILCRPFAERVSIWAAAAWCLCFSLAAVEPITPDRLAAIPLPTSLLRSQTDSTMRLGDELDATAPRAPCDYRDYPLLAAQPAVDLEDNPIDAAGYISDEERNRKILLTTGVGVGIITVWGIISWDYFTETPHGINEGWFGYHTKHGGADKLGHAYTSYLTAHLLSGLYEHWDFTPEDAALYGALTSFIIMSYMEFGDSFSENHGFSNEDFIINTFGCVMGYLTWRYPDLASKVDFRWEYGFKPYDTDITTDYENSKFLMAIKLNGWKTFQSSWLRHVEFHVGYYTRGYNDDDDDKTDRERTTYVGIGFNITDFLRRRGYRKTAKFFNYYQLPYTYYPYEWNHDN